MENDNVIWELMSDDELSDGPIFIEDYDDILLDTEKQYILKKKLNYEPSYQETSIEKKKKSSKSILNCIKKFFISILFYSSFILKILF